MIRRIFIDFFSALSASLCEKLFLSKLQKRKDANVFLLHPPSFLVSYSLFFFFFVGIWNLSFGSLNLSVGASNVDSLQNILKVSKEDTNKVEILLRLSWEILSNNPDLSMQYANNALELSEKLKFKKGIANSSNSIGIANYYLAKYDVALYYYKKSLPLKYKIGNKSSIARTIHNIGLIYKKTGDYPKALEYYLQALKLQEDAGDSLGVATDLQNIGSLHFMQNKFDKSLEFYNQALQIYQILKNDKGIADCFHNIANIYGNQQNSLKSIEYYQKSLAIKEKVNNKEGIANTLMGLALEYENSENFSKAFEYNLRALIISEELQDLEKMTICLNNMGEVLYQQSQYEKALDYCRKSLKIASEIGSKDDIKEAYFLMSNIYAKLNNYSNAYKYHLLYSAFKDSLFNEESSEQIAEMQTKYETEKKEQQINLLNKEKEIQTKDLQRQKTIRNAVAGFLLLVTGFLFVLINRFVLIRRQKKIIETERTKSEKLLLNILPKATADELKLHNKVVPKSYEMVTVMFTDFKGFTTIAEKMSAEELVSELDYVFKKFDEIISKYPIEKIKTIGDAYMCAGGLPIANTTNPLDVVMAALEIQQFMQEQNKWQLRIGVHSGPVIAGVVGDKKFAYDIWGDTVNTASRMESSGEPGKVNISGETYKLIVETDNCPSLQFKFRGKIPAKNKGEVEMYFVEKKLAI